MKVAGEIVVLKHGRERIIFNAELVNPIYFPRGGDKILRLLNELKSSEPFTSPPQFCSNELFDFLIFHSLLVPDDAGKIEHNCNECGQTHSGQKSLYLLLSHSCNQSCIYCFNGINTYNRDRHIMMSEEIAFAAIKETFATVSDRLEIVFFGGEPLLNWQLAKKIINYCEKNILPGNPDKSIAYHLTSNLTIFPDDLIDTAKRYKMTFLVDIDGPEEIHNKTRPFIDGSGSFGITAENIRKLVASGIKVSLRATVTSHNDSFMTDIAKTHKELGGESCAFVPLNPVDSDDNILPISLCPSPKKFASGLKEVFHSKIWPIKDLYPFNEYMGRLQPLYRNQWGCGAPFGNTPVITASGEIFSCIYLVGNKKYRLGHISSGDYPRRDVISYMLDTVNVSSRSDCRTCGYRFLCGGGCPVGIFSIEGNRNARAGIKRYVKQMACTVSKTVLRELLWDLRQKKGCI